VTNVSTEIETISGQLRLIPEDSTSFFRRGLGVIDPVNNKIRLRINLDLYRPQTSLSDKMTVVFGVYIGSSLIDQFTIFQDEISSGEKITQNFEREYNYENLSGNISLKISLTEGFSNQLFLDYLKCENSFFCQDDIRTYFILDELFERSFASVSSGIQLLEWKIDDIETLTTDFFTEITSTGGNPLTEWLFAKAEIDGSEREAETTTPNSFNPFVHELGLEFDTVDSFNGGKPIDTVSGSDYGTGIMTLGLEKPEVLNGELLSKKGTFFIDIDYTKNLRVVFNVLVNNLNSNVFDSPVIYRKYYIIWDAENCTSSFYYQDQLATNPLIKTPIDKDGFLYGITEGVSNQNIISCSESFSYNGSSGTFVFLIDFGTDIGECGINYDAVSVPDKFEIEWNEQIFTTGYVGSNAYDQQLLNLGISPTEINTGNPTTGAGELKFIKSLAQPTTAIIRVTAPLDGTGWVMSGICPQPVTSGDFTQITWDDTNTIENRSGNATSQIVFYSGEFFAVTDIIWQKYNGSIWVDVSALSGVTKTFTLENSLNRFRLKALNALLEEVYSNVLQYTKTNPTLMISSSLSAGGEGTIDFINGEPYEIISLSFALDIDPDSSFTSLEFGENIVVGSLESLHQTRTGEAILDSNGELHETYTFNPDTGYEETSCLVTITGRSGAGSIPTSNTTTII